MAEYKVGDWVRVKTANEIALTLDSNAKTNGNKFVAKMLKYCGVVGCITKVDEDGNFFLSTGGSWWWSPEWLRPTLRVGDTVRVKPLREIEAALDAGGRNSRTCVYFVKGPTTSGTKGMEAWVGATLTIRGVMPFGDVLVRENDWIWSPDWLEPIETAPEAAKTALPGFCELVAEASCSVDNSYPTPTCGWDAFVTAHPAAVAFLKAISFGGDGGFKIDADVTAKSLGVKAKAERWKPEYGEKFWFLSSDFAVKQTTRERCSVDNGRLEVGNCFATEEEAAKAAEEVGKVLAAFHSKAGN